MEESSLSTPAILGSWHYKSSTDINECFRDCDLEDVSHEGQFFTWNDGCEPTTRIFRKLDRVVANGPWFDLFRRSKAVFPPARLSDHSSCIILPAGWTARKRGMFRFNNFLTKSPNFLPLVKEAWESESAGTPMFKLVSSLKKVKNALKNLNGQNGDVHEEVLHTRKCLEDVQSSTIPHTGNCDIERQCKAAYYSTMAKEADFLRQKAKIKWIKEGDQCTKYFFKTVSGNHNRNMIISLIDESGNPTKGPEELKDLIEGHFKNALGSGRSHGTAETNRLRPYILNTVPDSQIGPLVRPVSNEEIRSVIFSIGDDRAPGPDGFTSKFFKDSWEITGHTVSEAIHDFFNHGKLLKQLNTTLISLIPKVQSPRSVTDFRPISCCNVIYKVISKILANRIKATLPFLVDRCQTAFVAGRQISDNILLAQELLHKYHLGPDPPRCTMKVDLMKAYDSIYWDFIINILTLMKFPPQMVNWICQCITTPMYSLNINGEVVRFFKGGKGLRQGDPLSPYLFVLVMEVLNDIIEVKARRDNQFKFHWKCAETQTVMLAFADDLLLFSQADSQSTQTLKECLDEFHATSDLSANPKKSEIFICSKDASLHQDIAATMGFKMGKLPIRYLGVPLITSRLSVSDCKSLTEDYILEM